MLGSRDWLLRRIEYSINIAETELDLSDKKIKELPPEIGSLRGLSILDLSDNYLTELPPEIGNLQHLASLNLSHNRLSTLLPELGQLSILRLLYLSNLLLTKLPSQIGQLRSLHTLDLSKNLLVTLPSEIVNLQNLRDLNLSQNHLSKLPPEIGSLRGLSILDLSDNYLTELPPEIGKLQNLHTLDLDGNSDLVSPPPSIVKQGMEAVLAYLRGLLISRTPVWQSKLLIVGEGGVGKTSLINNFTGKPYKPDENRTHGIDIDKIVLPHPEFDDVEMILNVWDFAGQTIEHATHRFFYSNRSLFLVVWNARLGYQQGKIPYWLDRINALAPESPILIVATHIDQNAPDIPLDELQLQYPQVKGQVAISNKTKEGILDLGEQIRQHAVSLPLMGELWPSTWLEVAERIRDIDAIYASPSELVDIALEGQLSETDALTLLTWMHELGDILYFSDVPELKDIVILNPQWVSERVSDVLHDSDIIATDGIFTREQMNITWKNIPQYMHQILLQFMERFDLSYIIPNDPDKKSLIVERLQHTPPEYYAIWQSLADQPELTMRFRIPESTMPAGIPTWFIARQHRFTTGNHWRTGVLFEKDDHWALVRAFPENRYVELSVRGPVPSNFFSLLRDGLDLTFNRFPGLNVKRLIPCPGHNGKPCSHEFLFEAVQRALELGRVSLECQKELLQVPVLELAYGVRITDKQYQEILDRLDGIDKVAKDTNRRVQDLELLQRSFTQEYRNDQENVDIRCPNVISIFPDRNQSDIKKLINRKMNLQLYCQHPGHWHLPINEHGRIIGHYPLNMPAGIMEQLSPILNKAIPLLKFAVPIAAPTIALLDVTYYEDEAKRRLDFTKALVNELKSIVSPKNTLDSVGYGYKETIKGSNLRVLRQLLEELDVTRVWGGLNYVRTPEGHSLWLCDEHAAHY